MSTDHERALAYFGAIYNLLQKSEPVDVARAMLHFARWLEISRCGTTPLEAELPWVTFGVIEQLDAVIKPGWRVFEYGSGGSTIYFLRKGCSVVSVEHDPEWLDRVGSAASRIEGCAKHWISRHAPPQKLPEAPVTPRVESPYEFFSNDERYHGCSFESYVRTIDEFESGAFNLVLVDGRSRPACIARSLAKVAPGGLLILDNSERAYYRMQTDGLIRDAGFELMYDSYCSGPSVAPDFWKTSIWLRMK